MQLKFLDGCRVGALRGQADRHDPLRVVAWKPVGDGEHPLSQLVREQIEQRCHICPQLGSLPENGTLAQEENLERRESVTLNDFLTCYLHVVRDQMGCEIHFHQGIPDPGHSEDGHHLVEDGFGGIQIVGPEILEDCLQEKTSSENVICERGKRV